MIERFNELNKWQKVGVLLAVAVLFGVLFHFGVDPALDWAGLNQ